MLQPLWGGQTLTELPIIMLCHEFRQREMTHSASEVREGGDKMSVLVLGGREECEGHPRWKEKAR